MKYATHLALSVALGIVLQGSPLACVAADGALVASGVDVNAIDNVIAQTEALCASRAQARPHAAPANTLFTRLGGEARIHVITREMVRLHRLNPTLSGIVRKYDSDYLADVLARYLITATGGPTRYDGPPLSATHAHLHISKAQFLAGGTDFSEAMKAVGATQDDITDTLCLLGGLKQQIVQQ